METQGIVIRKTQNISAHTASGKGLIMKMGHKGANFGIIKSTGVCWHMKQKYFIYSMGVQSLLSPKSWNPAGPATQPVLLSDTTGVPHTAPGISICLLSVFLLLRGKGEVWGMEFCGPSNCWSLSNRKEEESKWNVFLFLPGLSLSTLSPELPSIHQLRGWRFA